MNDISETLKTLIKGDLDTSEESRELFSHDASMFEMKPQLIIAPKDSQDIQNVVSLVAQQKASGNDISITARSAGTDMSGGAIGESIIFDMRKYMNKIGEVSATEAKTQPGVLYRDFEVETLKFSAIMPSYPASRDLCSVGGMVANNSGGEKSLEFGKTEEFVKELKVVFSDGKEYSVRPLNKTELDAKIAQNDFEGSIYKRVFDLVDGHYDEIKAAKPQVSKDSTGYHIWNVWDRETGIFDLTRLITGSQGTLGIVTDITYKLVPAPKHSGTLVVFLRNINDLGTLINKVMSHKPATFEGFDNYTLMLSFKLFLSFHKMIGWPETIKLAFKLIPNALMLFRGIPKMILLVEFTADTPEEVKQKVHAMHKDMAEFGHEALFEEDDNEAKAKKFWIMRRASFNLLRQKVKDKHTAPFMDDLIVQPQYLPEFLPRIRGVIKKYNLLATIAGHMGDGNFHIIPLMNIERDEERDKLEPAMKEINSIVLEYKGSLSGEHNDGMIRGPWLKVMYGEQVLNYFKEVKTIFDPLNIFNPHKKTDADWSFSMAHLRRKF
ncbi:MAG TPA: FAD-binding oxidoreductase [Candidatus Saccharibacteria bacterium]|jgi:FAD/FMN-containing dehydrogenase|nr:FAD-binding oxidoreductase [Candidatus Saccharibacteria bacterium]